jgi:hypothetical protein
MVGNHLPNDAVPYLGRPEFSTLLNALFFKNV